jgi:hypothetical protein
MSETITEHAREYGDINLLLLIQLRLQYLAVILHGLHIALLIGWLLRSGGIDVLVSEDSGRHCEWM